MLEASPAATAPTPQQRRLLGWVLVAVSPFPVLVAALVAWVLGRPGTTMSGHMPFPPWMLVPLFAVGSLLTLGVGIALLRGAGPASPQVPAP